MDRLVKHNPIILSMYCNTLIRNAVFERVTIINPTTQLFRSNKYLLKYLGQESVRVNLSTQTVMLILHTTYKLLGVPGVLTE